MSHRRAAWSAAAVVALAAINSAVINELRAGRPWWIAAVVLTGSGAWLAGRRTADDPPLPWRTWISSPWSGPVAMALGLTAIVWWPIRWQPEWLDFLPAPLLQLLQWLFLLVALGTLRFGSRVTGAILLTVVVGGLAAGPPVPATAEPTCGTTVIVVQPSLFTLVAEQLDDMKGKVACAEAVSLVDAGLVGTGLNKPQADASAKLSGSGMVAGGLITSDPTLITALSSTARSERDKDSPLPDRSLFRAEPVGSWTVIGEDVASVFLPATPDAGSDDPEVPFRRSVPLSVLSTLSYSISTPAALPVAMAMAMATNTALGRGPRLRSSTAGFEQERSACPARVVLPGSWSSPPCKQDALVRATVMDGRLPIGAPVLGVPLRSRADYEPGERTHEAVGVLFARLSRAPRANLVRVGYSATEAVDRLSRMEPLTKEKPIQLIAVVDASTSTGNADDSRGRGGLPRLTLALDGLAAVIGATTASTVTTDQTTTLIAQESGARRARRWTPGDQHPVTAHGRTGLPAVLKQVGVLRGEAERGGKRPITVLLTDGINLFKEDPVSDELLESLAVIVIGNRRGCREVPKSLNPPCVLAGGSTDDVAAKITQALTRP